MSLDKKLQSNQHGLRREKKTKEKSYLVPVKCCNFRRDKEKGNEYLLRLQYLEVEPYASHQNQVL